MEEIYARCDWCDTPISYGNASVSIDKNIQQVDRTDEDPDGIATVIQSDVVALFVRTAETASTSTRFETYYQRRSAKDVRQPRDLKLRARNVRRIVAAIVSAGTLGTSLSRRKRSEVGSVTSRGRS